MDYCTCPRPGRQLKPRRKRVVAQLQLDTHAGFQLGHVEALAGFEPAAILSEPGFADQ